VRGGWGDPHPLNPGAGPNAGHYQEVDMRKQIAEATMADYVRNAPVEPEDINDHDRPEEGAEDLSEDYPGQHITGPEVPPAPRELSFTLIHGYLRGDHACPFELHATGCRDLRSKQAKHLFNYEVLGVNQGAAISAALDTLSGTTKATDIWVQPCCGLKRMKAIGRA
jgi:hypothetical protein